MDDWSDVLALLLLSLPMILAALYEICSSLVGRVEMESWNATHGYRSMDLQKCRY
jgi:hypothetical protein